MDSLLTEDRQQDEADLIENTVQVGLEVDNSEFKNLVQVLLITRCLSTAFALSSWWKCKEALRNIMKDTSGEEGQKQMP